MNFPTLESYMLWRIQKRQEYDHLSKKIRDIKNKISEMHRNKNYAGNDQSLLISLRHDAFIIMEERKKAKEVSRDSWDKWMYDRLPLI